MENTNPTHLLSSLGILATFNIAKRISREEILRISNKIKKTHKKKSGKKFQQLLTDALIKSTKNYINKEIPPGLEFKQVDPKKEELDAFYMKLSIISQGLTDKFVNQKFTKHQVCFIINALINMLGLKEEDFEDFHKKFSKYKENDFSEYDE